MNTEKEPTALEYSPADAILRAAAYILRTDARLKNYSPDQNEDYAGTLEDMANYL